MAFQSILDEVLEAWRYTRAGVIDEIKNLSEVDLTFRPHAESRTAGELTVHIVQSGLMMAGELTRPDGSFQRKTYAQFMKEYAARVSPKAKKAELIRALKRAHTTGDRRIRASGELHMMQLITQFDGERGTRLAWFNHAISHEEYHRGQIALYARLVGRVPALTQLIRGG